MSQHKIIFDVDQDEDGYPPYGIETVWASASNEPGEYVLDNIPFFARQATLGDVVRVRETEAGLVFEDVVARSPNSLIRVAVYTAERVDEIRAALKDLGCSTEQFGRLVAVNIPSDTNLARVQSYLADLEDRDLASYEEPILRQ